MIEVAGSVLVDSNVIIDITAEDPLWEKWSVDALAACESVFVNPIIFAELCYLEDSPAAVDRGLHDLEIGFRELPKESLFIAAKALKVYRQRGGAKTSPLPDFFIGAHAAVLDVPILTRDTGRYRSYFPDVELISP